MMWKTRWLRPRPAGWLYGGLFQSQIVLKAALGFSQSRPISRLGRAGRPYPPCFSHLGHAQLAHRA